LPKLLTLILYYCASFNGHQTAGHSIKTVVVPAKAAEHQPLATAKQTLAELGRRLVDDQIVSWPATIQHV